MLLQLPFLADLGVGPRLWLMLAQSSAAALLEQGLTNLPRLELQAWITQIFQLNLKERSSRISSTGAFPCINSSHPIPPSLRYQGEPRSLLPSGNHGEAVLRQTAEQREGGKNRAMLTGRMLNLVHSTEAKSQYSLSWKGFAGQESVESSAMGGFRV